MNSLDTSKDFMNHVFNTNTDSKNEMMNIIQYAVLSIIPIVLLNKTMSKYVPEAQDTKGSVEVVAEVVLQVIVMFIGLLLIHRVNTFIPTFSGVKYPDFNVIFVVSSVLMITLSLQTKLGEKVSLLSDRVMQLWEGREGLTSQPAEVKNGNGVKVSQPLAGQGQGQVQQMPSVHVCADNMAMNSTAISQLPQGQMNVPPTTATTTIANNMMQNNSPPPAQQVNMMQAPEPMAANEGGGAFGSVW